MEICKQRLQLCFQHSGSRIEAWNSMLYVESSYIRYVGCSLLFCLLATCARMKGRVVIKNTKQTLSVATNHIKIASSVTEIYKH